MITKGLFTSNTSEWATPQAFFNDLDREFHFTLDPCSTDDNAKCELHYTVDNDGLTQDWGGAKSILQPAVWSPNQGLGQEVLDGVPKAKHSRCYAYPCTDGYLLLSRLHLWEGKGDPIHQGKVAFQRKQTGSTIPKYGCDILKPKKRFVYEFELVK